ncbi:hypothetical protein D3C86_2100550 [compost metagenome]
MAVITAEPCLYPVMTPFSTSATASSLEVQVARELTFSVVPPWKVAVSTTAELSFSKSDNSG